MPPAAAAAAAGGTTRWCPTAEQLMILEEMYNRGGVRTPSAAQIQQITAHLSLYGRVEGKNVFYWFQNHKARDRQRLRRRLLSRQPQPLLQPPHQLYYQPYFHHPQQQQQHTYGLNAPSSFFHQGGSMYMEDYEPAHAMSNTWTKWGMREINGGDSCELENRAAMMRGDVDDRAAMMRGDVGPTCPHNSIPNNRPLKTLQLFPVTTTCTLKGQSTTTTSTTS